MLNQSKWRLTQGLDLEPGRRDGREDRLQTEQRKNAGRCRGLDDYVAEGKRFASESDMKCHLPAVLLLQVFSFL